MDEEQFIYKGSKIDDYIPGRRERMEKNNKLEKAANMIKSAKIDRKIVELGKELKEKLKTQLDEKDLKKLNIK